ncbi:HlyD family type I secretion periplasmic adaptor subunit [Campylobacter fetus]|uniref:HlyD family type I secretion periplasmic adaptor subunit n=1 Tax=Campylobacter fetus TaxID=196 RepID=Q9R8D9_CAMFE|nr:HlyD family type I secretion periplasmic adaptor subunit [Campylobacter fetus]AAC97198.1 SapE [Campylobacter fetus]EAI4415598.1 HlyD family type I secretion periplasmic adaptor subunit [Campylobacter fetus]EAI5408752.1 HlyD family type I secretion periplasmic adaptor subunit [Campylobacter fetus]EAJ0328322.1 HlyD family type I secretion periplasmic adaptor subunit [Campylobacter fetus]EAJ1231043.1 HlyD family type I secretion periplasmic adaptor subunit [Campylobacter fetus]
MVLKSESGTVKLGLFMILLLVGIFGVWMGTAPLNSAAVAPGQVGVLSNKKVVQHLEGGVVDKIYVKDGDVVKKGQVLIEIKNVRLNSELDIVKSEYLQTSVLVSRLEAQRDDKDQIEFNNDVKSYPDFESASKGQISIFNEQNKLLKDEITILNQRIDQLRKQIEGINAIVDAKKQRVESLNEETKEWERLFKEQLTDKIRLRDIQRERTAAGGEIASGISDIAKLNVQITETKQQILFRERTFKEDVLKKYEEAKLKLTDLSARLRALDDQQERALVKAPVDGIVVELATHTIGGVVRPGESIMSIVPDDSDYIMEAKMHITDIDKVYVGLPADIRFSAFNSKTAHVIEGEVTYVSADTLKDSHGNPYYEIKAKLTKKGIEEVKKNGFFLVPGMPAEIIVKTGERTVLSYIIKPFTDMFQRAFNED